MSRPVNSQSKRTITSFRKRTLHLVSDAPPLSEIDYKVLVINSSHEMAKEITLQITLKIPGCSITYAPSLELARWILLRRHIDLVVSCPVLPDGSISKLNAVLAKARSQPDVVVVGNIEHEGREILKGSDYRFSAFKRLAAIKSLGADLRNDLNNPLQEIVAMVFVAKTGGASTPQTQQALEAIDRAAQNMAKVVRSLEEKILKTVR